jgi:three-Cys-motif partner protein
MTENFHKKPFDEGTMVKLRLFENYIGEWLPVFISSARGKRINIVDFFAGPGSDVNGVNGSPLIALKQIRKFTSQIRRSSSSLCLLLNEKAKIKAASLRGIMESQMADEGLCTLDVTALDFEKAFDKYYPELQGSANLLFLDQTGVKFISNRVFSRILDIPTTDFIFFIASSSLRRFADHPYFRRHLEIPKGTISARSFNETHRVVTEYYRSLIPRGKEFYLGSFSIKKGSNLYGVIFGSGHPLGIEKFLKVCWKEDPTRGEANFDIDLERIDIRSPHLFSDMDKPKKLNLFEMELQRRLLGRILVTDRDVYLFALQEGFLPMHARDMVTRMIKNASIAMVDRGVRPRISSDGYKEPRSLEVVQNGNL